jgi:hypothetical protein
VDRVTLDQTSKSNLTIDQRASSRMIDPTLAQKTPLTAYYENRYVEELEKEGFFKKLWQ